MSHVVLVEVTRRMEEAYDMLPSWSKEELSTIYPSWRYGHPSFGWVHMHSSNRLLSRTRIGEEKVIISDPSKSCELIRYIFSRDANNDSTGVKIAVPWHSDLGITISDTCNGKSIELSIPGEKLLVGSGCHLFEASFDLYSNACNHYNETFIPSVSSLPLIEEVFYDRDDHLSIEIKLGERLNLPQWFYGRFTELYGTLTLLSLEKESLLGLVHLVEGDARIYIRYDSYEKDRGEFLCSDDAKD